MLNIRPLIFASQFIRDGVTHTSTIFQQEQWPFYFFPQLYPNGRTFNLFNKEAHKKTIISHNKEPIDRSPSRLYNDVTVLKTYMNNHSWAFRSCVWASAWIESIDRRRRGRACRQRINAVRGRPCHFYNNQQWGRNNLFKLLRKQEFQNSDYISGYKMGQMCFSLVLVIVDWIISRNVIHFCS